MIARAAPEGAVFLVEKNRRDRARCFSRESHRVAHAAQLAANPGWYLLIQRHASRLGPVLTERTAHLVAGDVCRFARLLHGHAELDDVKKKLQQVLVLRVAALHGETKKQFAVLE